MGSYTDVKKMYDTVKLREEHWCFQRYIWHNELDKRKIPEEKVIKTLMYGVKSSGNQSERRLRETARMSAVEFSEVNHIVQKNIYVDECLSGAQNLKHAMIRADQIKLVLNRGGFSLKGVTFSGKDPPATLTNDKASINVAGMRWFLKEDLVSLDISELNFAKKCRGKKPSRQQNIIPANITRRHCVSEVSEIFDLAGKITAITATMKLDLHTLVKRGLDWDDVLLDELRPKWVSHFKMMQEIGKIKFQRAVVAEDAINLDIRTIDAADASQKLACVAIYTRFLKKDGTHSWQLVFSRSKLIPDGLSQPRAELFPATTNADTGEFLGGTLQENHKGKIKLTESQVVLHWLSNHEKAVKQWVRSSVTEILRFTDNNMIADLGTS